MSTAMPNLWPENLSTDVLPPLAILRAQAGLLGKITKGILEAEVTSVAKDDVVRHQLDVIAPALDGYRHRLLVVEHESHLVYPAIIDPDSNEAEFAQTPQNFINRLQTLLNSGQVLSVITSLIARSNEVTANPARGAPE